MDIIADMNLRASYNKARKCRYQNIGFVFNAVFNYGGGSIWHFGSRAKKAEFENLRI